MELMPLFTPLAFVVIGLWSAVSPFALAYWLFTGAYGWCLSRLIGAHGAALAVSAGGTALWASMLMTERRLPQAYPLQLGDPNAEAGFPLVAFRYPHPPMGNDVPPLAQWLPFFADYAFWLLVGIAVAPLLARLLPEKTIRLRYALLPALVVALLGLGRTMLKFD